jgi:hypothetical protein
MASAWGKRGDRFKIDLQIYGRPAEFKPTSLWVGIGDCVTFRGTFTVKSR